jgi:uncharacterized metal-binding protein
MAWKIPMPNGKTHALSTLITAGTLGAGLYLIAGTPLATAAVAFGGCLAGLLINPDLDIRHSTESRRLVRQTAGPVFGAAWAGLWWPYSHFVIPSHRHPLSHLPLVGTAIRLIYLLIIYVMIWGLLRLAFPLPFAPHLPLTTALWWWAAGGLALSDTLHTLMDLFWPFK